MHSVIGVKIHDRGETIPYETKGLDLEAGTPVVVEAPQGISLGFCYKEPYLADLGEEALQIIRKASFADLERYEANVKMEQEAMAVCRELVESHDLPMHLVEAEILLDNARLIIYFTAEGRVDFRGLVKDLAAQFHMRIELRQIGVRDEARLLGGLGICGRELCCRGFMKGSHPVSIKMAKEQNLSMNPAKISGACGRLLCCLKFEQEAYVDANKRMPKRGDKVSCAEGTGIVQSVHVLKESCLVRLDVDDSADAIHVKASDLTIVESCKRSKKRKS